MKIKIVAFGKLDGIFFKQASEEYKKRISKYADLEIIELKEEFQSDLLKNIKLNSQLIEKTISKFNDYEIVVLNVKSKNINSKKFADILNQNKNFKSGKIIFLIGPSDGFDEKILQKYQSFSFSQLTFPHQLFRIILLEQIYRSFKIINNEKYHK